MSNSDFLGTAKVAIVPDFSKFRKELRSGLNKDVGNLLNKATSGSTRALTKASKELGASAKSIERASASIKKNVAALDTKSSRKVETEARSLNNATKTLGEALKKVERQANTTLSRTVKNLREATRALQVATRAMERASASNVALRVQQLRAATVAFNSASRGMLNNADKSVAVRTQQLKTAATAFRQAGVQAGKADRGGFRGAFSTGRAAGGEATLRTTIANARATKKLGDESSSATAKVLGLGNATGKLNSALLGLRTAIGSTAVIGLGAGALAAIALGNALRSLVRNFVAFETTINTFGAVTGASASQLERVGLAAKELGADITLPGVSAGDAAEAMLELAKAGLTVQESIDGARGVLQLATAAAITNSEAVQIAASAINAFGLAGRDAIVVADALANAANLSQGSIADIGLALQQSAAAAKQVGVGFQDTATFLTFLAQAGLKGSDAGTSLRVALIRLINPTKKAAELIDELGVKLRDAQGNIRVDVFQQFANALRGQSKEQRDATIATIAGQDAMRAFSILGRQSISSLLKMRAAIREQGTAAEVAAARTKGLGGAAGALASTMQTLGIELGTRVAPGATAFVHSITQAIGAVSESEGALAGFNTVLEASGAALAVVGHAAATTAPLLLSLTGALGTLASAIGGGQILAGIAAFVLFRKALLGITTGTGFIGNRFLGIAIAVESIKTALSAASVASRQFTGAARGAAAAGSLMGSARVGIAGLAASLGSAIGKTNAIAAGVAILAGGLLFLATRASASEKAVKALSQATDDLATSVNNLNSARETETSLDRQLARGKVGLEQAALNERLAREALASSSAPEGSNEERQLRIQLATATQDVAFATEDYNKALTQLAQASAITGAAEKQRSNAVDEAVKTTERLIETSKQQVVLGGARIRVSLAEATARRAVAGADSTAAALRKQAAREEATSLDASVLSIAKRKKVLADLIDTAKDTNKINIRMVLDPETSLKQVGEALKGGFRNFGFASAEEFMKWFRTGLNSNRSQFDQILEQTLGLSFFNFFTKLNKIIAPAGAAAGRTYAEEFAEALATVEGIIQDRLAETVRKATSKAFTLEAEERDIKIAGGGDAAILGIKQQQLSQAKEVLAALEDESTGLTGDALAKKKKEINAQKDKVIGLMDEIVALEASLAAEAKKRADEIKDKRRDAAQAIVDAFSGAQDKAELAVTIAQGTKGLADDIRFTIALRNLVAKQIAQIQKRIKDLRDSGKLTEESLEILKAAITASKVALAGLRNDVIGLFKDRQDAQKQLVQDLVESATLDAQLANINENVNAEIAAKQRLITALRKAQALEKEGSNAWKQYRNQIAQTKKEIEELRKTKKEQNQAFKALSFEFLQTQQGFAANLLGNLIPLGATQGLVGNTSSGGAGARKGAALGVSVGVSESTQAAAFGVRKGAAAGIGTGVSAGIDTGVSEAAAIAASVGKGPTSSQMTTLIHVSREMLKVLHDLRRGVGHPEAKRSKVTNKHAQDYGNGG